MYRRTTVLMTACENQKHKKLTTIDTITRATKIKWRWILCRPVTIRSLSAMFRTWIVICNFWHPGTLMLRLSVQLYHTTTVGVKGLSEMGRQFVPWFCPTRIRRRVLRTVCSAVMRHSGRPETSCRRRGGQLRLRAVAVMMRWSCTVLEVGESSARRSRQSPSDP